MYIPVCFNVSFFLTPEKSLYRSKIGYFQGLPELNSVWNNAVCVIVVQNEMFLVLNTNMNTEQKVASMQDKKKIINTDTILLALYGDEAQAYLLMTEKFPGKDPFWRLLYVKSKISNPDAVPRPLGRELSRFTLKIDR